MNPTVLTCWRTLPAVSACALALALAACEQKPSTGTSIVHADLKSTPAPSPAGPQPGVPEASAVRELVAQARAVPEPSAAPAAPSEKAEPKPPLPRSPTGAGKPSTARPVGDAELAARVKSALLAQPLSALMFNVTVSKGVVTLSGTADTRETRDKAARAAAGVDGVKSVDNRINVLSGS